MDGFVEKVKSEGNKHCCESGSADQAELDLTLSANERAFPKALDRHLATTGTPTTDSIHVASDANVGTDPVYPSSSR